MSFHPLEHDLLRQIRDLGFSGRSVVVALSGGRDSTALAHALSEIQPAAQIELAFAHVHHGPGEHQEARDWAQAAVAKLAGQKNIPLFSRKSPNELPSESEMRDFRYTALEEMALRFAERPIVAFAHFAEDQLETQLMRLIRGTSQYGIQGMSQFRDGMWWRPLLEVSSNQIQSYAQEKNLLWVEDPSNESLEPLRNWMRHRWLPQLEERVPGATRNMVRSLERIAGARNDVSRSANFSKGLKVSDLLSLSRSDQRAMVAQYFRFLQLDSFRQSHVDEVLKRLDMGRRDLIFSLLKRQWAIEEDWLFVRSTLEN